jgi:hypothetical protein
MQPRSRRSRNGRAAPPHLPSSVRRLGLQGSRAIISPGGKAGAEGERVEEHPPVPHLRAPRTAAHTGMTRRRYGPAAGGREGRDWGALQRGWRRGGVSGRGKRRRRRRGWRRERVAAGVAAGAGLGGGGLGSLNHPFVSNHSWV